MFRTTNYSDQEVCTSSLQYFTMHLNEESDTIRLTVECIQLRIFQIQKVPRRRY